MEILTIVLKTLAVFITLSCVFAKKETCSEESKITWLLLLVSILIIFI